MNTRIEVLLWANRVVATKKSAAPHELLEIAPDATLDDAQAAFHKIAKIAHPDLHRGLNPDELEMVTAAYSHVANAYQTIRSARMRGVPVPTNLVAPATPVTPPPAATTTGRVKRPSDQPANVRLPGGGILRGTKQIPTSTSSQAATHPPPTSSPAPSSAQSPPTQRSVSGSFARPPRAKTTPPPPANTPPGSSPGMVPPPPSEDAVGAGPTLTGATPAQSMSSKALTYYRKAEQGLRQGDLRAATLNLKMAIAADPHSTFLRQALAEVEQELKNQ